MCLGVLPGDLGAVAYTALGATEVASPAGWGAAGAATLARWGVDCVATRPGKLRFIKISVTGSIREVGLGPFGGRWLLTFRGLDSRRERSAFNKYRGK